MAYRLTTKPKYMSTFRDPMDYDDGRSLQIAPSRVNQELYRASAGDDFYDTTYSDEEAGLPSAAASSSRKDSSSKRAAEEVVRVDRRRKNRGTTTKTRSPRTVSATDGRVANMRNRQYGDRPDWSDDRTAPFTASTTYDDDPAHKLKATRDFYMKRILFADYPFKYLMILDVVSVCMYMSFAVVSGMVAATGAAEINTYLYLIIGTVINGLVTLGAHLPMSVFYWMKRGQRGLTHDHLISTTMPIIVSIPVMIFGWFGLGRWISSYGACCDIDDNQPNPLFAEEYNQFVWGHASLAVASIFAFMYFPQSILAHLYPEVDVKIQDQMIHLSTLEEAEESDDVDQ